MSDEEIMKHLDTNPETYGILIERYEEPLRRYIRRISSLGSDDVDDLLQDIFIKGFERSASFNTSFSFKSWIYRICHNETINAWKKNKKRESDVAYDEQVQETYGHVDESLMKELDLQSDKETVQRALNAISVKYRSIVVLRFFEEREYKEISDILKIPPGTVATHVHRAKKALAKQIEKLEEVYE